MSVMFCDPLPGPCLGIFCRAISSCNAMYCHECAKANVTTADGEEHTRHQLAQDHMCHTAESSNVLVGKHG